MGARAILLADAGAAASEGDFFRCREFYAAERVTHSLMVEHDHERAVAAPLIVRPIEGTDLSDAQSPYGYPGAVRNTSELLRPADVEWSGTGLVSIFLRDRLTPPPAFPGGTLRSQVHVADPGHGLSIRSTHRRHINRNLRLGYGTRRLPGAEAGERELQGFARVYRETMVRAGAASRYFLGEEYFSTVLRSTSCWLMLAAAPDARVAAGAIAVRSDGMLHYYLGGTGDAFLEHSPFKNVVQAMLELAGELSLPLNLGGGVRPGDALEHFKAGFANRTAPFCTHEVVCRPDAYEELSAGRPSGDFFPSYRAPGERAGIA